jgi:hypothetical protein
MRNSKKPGLRLSLITVLAFGLALLALSGIQASTDPTYIYSWVSSPASVARSLANPQECPEGTVCREECYTDPIIGESILTGYLACVAE